MLEAAVPERSSALSICMVMRLERPGRGSGLVVVALSSIGREVEVLAVLTSGWASVDVVTSPAVVCACGIARRVGADMVACVEICWLVSKSGVDEDDGSGVEAVASRLERSVFVNCMFGECAVCICQSEEVRMSVGGLCSRARSRALSPARARACEWTSRSELHAQDSSHKGAFM